MNNEPTEAGAVSEIVRESALPIFKQPADHGTAAPLLVNPRTCAVESLEKFLPTPTRKRATVTVRDHDSFIDYVKLHQEPGTLIMADLDTTGASFTAILDYHLSNGEPKVDGFKPGAAGWGNHQCKLVLQHTPEWKAWAKMDGQGMTQAQMAVFLEDNRLDVCEPDDATLIEIAKSIEAVSGARFKSGIRLDNGDRTLQFESNTTASAGGDRKLTIPEKFKLKVPVFVNGPAFEMEAFFRYRQQGTDLVLFYNLIRAHKVIELAVEASREAIEGETKLQVHNGQAQVLTS